MTIPITHSIHVLRFKYIILKFDGSFQICILRHDYYYYCEILSLFKYISKRSAFKI